MILNKGIDIILKELALAGSFFFKVYTQKIK